MKPLYLLLTLAAATIAPRFVSPTGPPTTLAPIADAEYVARLAPINSAGSHVSPSGEVRFVVHGDSLTITAHLSNVAPGIEHWQHFHGKPDGSQSRCPTAAADTSGDHLVDILETEPAAGTTMVPFNADPVAMDIPTNTYPHASANGTYDYVRTVSLAALQAAFGQHYSGHAIDLARRVVMVHGVPESITLPRTVASLGPIPARTTFPIACGAIIRVR